jgi:hypothetical protein
MNFRMQSNVVFKHVRRSGPKGVAFPLVNKNHWYPMKVLHKVNFICILHLFMPMNKICMVWVDVYSSLNHYASTLKIKIICTMVKMSIHNVNTKPELSMERWIWSSVYHLPTCYVFQKWVRGTWLSLLTLRVVLSRGTLHIVSMK